MKKRYSIILLSLFTAISVWAQNIPNNRKVDWSIAGYEGEIPCITTERNAVSEFGIDNTGATDVSNQVNNALNAISEGEALYFPEGTYLFENGIKLNQN